ncbi:hypothetical protein SLA2020_325260 [Shorea laevis]
MAEIALTFLSPVLEEAVSKTVSFVKKRIGAVVGLEKELDRLGDSLTLIKSVIQHSEEIQESDPAIRRWLQKLQDVGYEIVDVLDECEYKVRKHKAKSRGEHWNPESAFFSPLFRNRMAGKIKDITEQLSYLKGWASMISLVVSLRDQTCSRQYPKIESLPDNSKFFGRRDHVSKFPYMVLDSKCQHGQHPISEETNEIISETDAPYLQGRPRIRSRL